MCLCCGVVDKTFVIVGCVSKDTLFFGDVSWIGYCRELFTTRSLTCVERRPSLKVRE